MHSPRSGSWTTAACLFPFALLACSSSEKPGGSTAPPSCEPEVCLDTPENGFKLESNGTTIGQGFACAQCPDGE